MGSCFPFGFLNGPATANSPGTMDHFILSTSRTPVTTTFLAPVPYVLWTPTPGALTTNLPGAWPVAAPAPAPAPPITAQPLPSPTTLTMSAPIPGLPTPAPPVPPPAAPPAPPAAPPNNALPAPTPGNAPPALPAAPVITTAPPPPPVSDSIGPFGSLAADGGWGPWGPDHGWATGPWTSWWGGAAPGAGGCPGSTWAGWTSGSWSVSAPWTTWTACTGAVTGTTAGTYTFVTDAPGAGVATVTTSGPITEYSVAEATAAPAAAAPPGGDASSTTENNGLGKPRPKITTTGGFAQGAGGPNYSSASTREDVDTKVLVAGSLLAIAIGVLGWL